VIPRPFAVKSFADFLCGSEAKKAGIVKKYKNRNPEAIAMSGYYSSAKAAILAFNRKRDSRQWLLQQAVELEKRALVPNKSLRTKLLCNAKAVRMYEQHFGHKHYEYLKPEKFRFSLRGVTVNVTPDVHVIDEGVERYVKFYFGSKKLNYIFARTITDCMSYGVSVNKDDAAGPAVAYVDISTGTIHSGNVITDKVVDDISKGCEELVRVWDMT